ncbi:serine/threonine protein kinase [Clostridium thermarum]|uniref:serine/threonine protein kinase n=1 Tax=Clostridium thermarum TaxID=1716543 RepID=UPI0013D2E6B2|nr:serine/threonine protein kinase [Clostridium thermarum]
MKKYRRYRAEFLGHDIDKLKLIGMGHEGKVYLLPNDRVLKVFYKEVSCKKQIEILIKAQNSRFFPTVYAFDNRSIIMSFVYGSTLSYYLRQNNINKHISLELCKLIDEFKRLQFTRLDMRLGHIFLQPDESIKVIDPRDSFKKKVPYPTSMLRGLQKSGELMEFFRYIQNDYPHYYKYWMKMMAKAKC